MAKNRFLPEVIIKVQNKEFEKERNFNFAGHAKLTFWLNLHLKKL